MGKIWWLWRNKGVLWKLNVHNLGHIFLGKCFYIENARANALKIKYRNIV